MTRLCIGICLVLLMVGGTGCIGSDTQRCSWGVTCPSGTLCDDEHERCVAPGQLESCRGQGDGADCTYPAAPAGRYYCVDGVCVPSRCGDEVLGGDEVCEDGNVESGDGCSADCLSEEVCGNRYVDVELGESCDDGNQLNHDGCTSACVQEYPDWSALWATLPGLFGMSAASDELGQRVVLHGGVTDVGDFMDATWTFDGSTWERMLAPEHPAARMDAAMAYDGGRQQVVLYGGWGGEESLDDTWVLAGETWQRLEPTQIPGARSGTSMVYDSARDRLVIFGGELGTREVLESTWELVDGGGGGGGGDMDWVERPAVGSPGGRRYHGMAYDPLRARVVLFGGSHGVGEDWAFLGDTWEYDGVAWTQRFPSSTPPARDSHTLVWDPQRERVVMYSGHGPTGLLSDTWEYDGVDWVLLNTPYAPNGRGQYALAPDPTAPRLVLVGGTTGLYQAWDDMWQLGGAGWTRVDSRVPRARMASGMVYDDARQRAVMFGGLDDLTGGVMFNDTWEYDGHTWTQARPTNVPAGRGTPAMVYDSQRQRTVLFGGLMSHTYGDCEDDLWEYDGVDWESVELSPRPPARGAAAFVYEPVRQVMVLFGGGCGFTPLADTWEYDGSSWREVFPTADGTAPSGRIGATMAWSPERQCAVLFGGQNAEKDVLSDTWEYCDGEWFPVEAVNPPSPRAGHGLVFNHARNALTLLAGYTDIYDIDAWELRGETWFEMQTSHPPNDRFAAGVVYFPPSDGVLIFSGFNKRNVPMDQLLRFRFDGASPDEVCSGGIDEDGDSLVDCADPDCEGRPCGFMQVCLVGQCF